MNEKGERVLRKVCEAIDNSYFWAKANPENIGIAKERLKLATERIFEEEGL